LALTNNHAEAPICATQASLLISSDMAYAVHPNYAAKLHGGGW
jgi:aspartyl aminopeptidase